MAPGALSPSVIPPSPSIERKCNHVGERTSSAESFQRLPLELQPQSLRHWRRLTMSFKGAETTAIPLDDGKVMTCDAKMVSQMKRHLVKHLVQGVIPRQLQLSKSSNGESVGSYLDREVKDTDLFPLYWTATVLGLHEPLLAEMTEYVEAWIHRHCDDRQRILEFMTGISSCLKQCI